MKREIAVFLIITMVLSLSACGKTLKGTDGLIEKAREEIPISDSDTIDLQYAGMCGNDNRAIAWFISGNEYQKHYYLPMEVEVKEDAAEYTFIRTYKPIDDRIGDIAYIQWGDGYGVFVKQVAGHAGAAAPNQRKILGGKTTWRNEGHPVTAWYASVTMVAGKGVLWSDTRKTATRSSTMYPRRRKRL